MISIERLGPMSGMWVLQGGTYPLQTTAPGGINNYTIDGYNYNGNSYSVSSVAGADYRQVDIIIDYQ